MPRKGEVPKRKPLPDPKYTDQPVDVRRRITKFVNTVMESGKKSIAEGIVYGAFDLMAEKAAEDPVKVWDKAMTNTGPWDIASIAGRLPKELGPNLKPRPVPWPEKPR